MSDESQVVLSETDQSNAAKLERWERRTNPIIMVAAILPIAVAFTPRHHDQPTVWLDLASWLVFIVDYVVHFRLKPGYARTKLGIFDLAIVIVTAPWYLVFGGTGRFLGLARLGRLGRVFMVSKHSQKLKELGSRLGQAALYSGVLILVCSAVVEAVEPASEGFVHFSDALWWGIVTFTTVGYGDLVPTTAPGRTAGVILMIGGVALIGSLAGSLGSFFQKTEDTGTELAEMETMQRELLTEVRELRAEIAQLRAQQDD